MLTNRGTPELYPSDPTENDRIMTVAKTSMTGLLVLYWAGTSSSSRIHVLMQYDSTLSCTVGW